MNILKSIIISLALLATTALSAQTITSVHGNVSDDMGPLMGATVCEIDGNGRIIESALTDLNGNFTMRVKNPKDRIRFSYVGSKTVIQPINRTNYKIVLQSATQLKEVTIKSKRRVIGGNGLPIPEREIANATQTLNMKELEGLSYTTIDEAIQGRIAGLCHRDADGNADIQGFALVHDLEHRVVEACHRVPVQVKGCVPGEIGVPERVEVLVTHSPHMDVAHPVAGLGGNHIGPLVLPALVCQGLDI